MPIMLFLDTSGTLHAESPGKNGSRHKLALSSKLSAQIMREFGIELKAERDDAFVEANKGNIRAMAIDGTSQRNAKTRKDWAWRPPRSRYVNCRAVRVTRAKDGTPNTKPISIRTDTQRIQEIISKMEL